MRKLIVLIIGILICSNFFTQSIERFIKMYEPNPFIDAQSFGILTTSYGYILSGINMDTLNGLGFLNYTLIGVNFQGEKIWEKKYGDYETNFSSGFFYINHLNRFNSLNYSICSIYDFQSDKYFNKLFAFDDQGDTLWTKDFHEILSFSYNAMNITNDGGFILSGYLVNENNEMQKQLLTKTDVLGNIEWSTTHAYVQSYTPQAILQDINTNKYIIVGSEYDFNLQIPKPFIKILNENGGIQNSVTLNFNFGGGIVNIKQLNDGNFIACGLKNTNIFVGSWKLNQSVIVKFDINGNVIWTKTFGKPAIINSFSEIIVLENDEVIVGGEVDTLYTLGLGLNTNFQLYKLSETGDSLWSKNIDLHPDIQGQDILKQIVKANDQGYAITGYSENALQSKFVLVKTDEYGCVVENCQTATLKNEKIQHSENTIFPNPVTNFISFQNDKLETDKFELIDVSGQIVLSGNISFEKEIVILVSNLANATYFLKLYKENKVVKNELIIVNH